MSSTVFEYRIRLDADRTESFRYELDSESFDLAGAAVDEAPDWTELGYRQCPNCPLSTDEHSHCPLALQLHGLVSRFDETRSIDEVAVEVRTPDRDVRKSVALQDALASILDLVIPVCGCPVTEVMKPLARFHLPLASEEETIFRVTGMYLLTQYFQNAQPGRASTPFDGLGKIYEDLHQLNTAVAQRLQHATASDSVKNAVALVDMYSLLIPVLLEDQLAELRSFFSGSLTREQAAEPAGSSHLQSAKDFRRDAGTQEEGGDSRTGPSWLRKIALGTATVAERVEHQLNVAELLKKADSLALEPMGDEEPEPTDGFNRAVYKLPDD